MWRSGVYWILVSGCQWLNMHLTNLSDKVCIVGLCGTPHDARVNTTRHLSQARRTSLPHGNARQASRQPQHRTTSCNNYPTICSTLRRSLLLCLKRQILEQYRAPYSGVLRSEGQGQKTHVEQCDSA